MNNNTPQRVAIYARYSTTHQSQNSIRAQTTLCEKHVNKMGWKVVKGYADEAISGTNSIRPEYQEMRHAIKSGAVDIILAESLDRFSRDQEDTANLYKLCLFHEVALETVTEGTVTELHVGMSSTINAVFIKQIAQKVRRSLSDNVDQGKSAGGKAYGYAIPFKPNGERDKGNLVIVDEQASIIVRILEDYVAGISPKKIAIKLNDEGIPSPSGKYWKMNTILGNRKRGIGILNNELYIGRRIWNRMRFLKKPGTKQRISRLNPIEEWNVQEVPHLRIVR